MSKLWTAKVLFKYVLVADDEQSALVAARAYAGDAWDMTRDDELMVEVRPDVHAPGWDGDCFPVNATEDKTIRMYEEGA